MVPHLAEGAAGSEAQVSCHPGPAESGKPAGLGVMSFQSEPCVPVLAQWMTSETSPTVSEMSGALATKWGKYYQT